jgi:hypothetical protein
VIRRAAALAALALPAVLAASAGGVSAPHCYGAAARDPLHPCDNPKLRYSVVPSPADALIMPDSPCDPAQGPGVYHCTFGSPPADASDTVALIGDSHATHWRSALLTVAGRKHWHGLSITRPSCPFTQATESLPEPERSQCLVWNHDVLDFVNAHPEISTVFVSEHHGVVETAPGADPAEEQIRGYTAAWAALPSTVQHIIVIRDTPYDRTHTGDCVVRARRRRLEPGLACAIRRSRALNPDPAAIAARRLAGTRVSLVDMTPYMCSRALCYPVVGGVLVHKDANHIGVTFGTTLGPYLLRAVNRLLAVEQPAARR